jgi:hypothetical protein
MFPNTNETAHPTHSGLKRSRDAVDHHHYHHQPQHHQHQIKGNTVNHDNPYDTASTSTSLHYIGDIYQQQEQAPEPPQRRFQRRSAIVGQMFTNRHTPPSPAPCPTTNSISSATDTSIKLKVRRVTIENDSG